MYTLGRIDKVDPVAGTVINFLPDHYFNLNTWVEGISSDATGLWVVANPAVGMDRIDHISLPGEVVTTLVTEAWIGHPIVSAGEFLYRAVGT